MPAKTLWLAEHDAALRDGVERRLSFAQIGALIGRSRNACIGRSHRLGIVVPKGAVRNPGGRPRGVSPERANVIRNMLGRGETLAEIGRALGSSYQSIQRSARVMGLTSGARWTAERDAQLVRLFDSEHSFSEIGRALGVSRNSAMGRALRLGLKRADLRVANNRRMTPKPKPPPPPKAPRPQPDEIVAMKPTCDLLALGARMCRWPIGDPQDAAFGFCGCPAPEGKPYCAAHAAIAYQATGSTKDLIRSVRRAA